MSEKQERIYNLLHKVIEILIIIAALVAMPTYFTTIVDDKINDQEYLLKVAKKVRPFLIFDQDEIFHYDLGATSYIDSISIQNSEFLETVTVYFNSYMQNAPLLEPIGSYENYSGAIPQRGKNKSWKFLIHHTGLGETGKYKFRLEILY